MARLADVLPAPLERQEQRALFQWAATQHVTHPELRWLYAIPNAGGSGEDGRIRGRIMVGEGLRRGYPDVGLDVARGGCHGLRVELKRRKGGRLEPEQVMWREHFIRQGYAWAGARGWEEARDRILDYLAGRALPDPLKFR